MPAVWASGQVAAVAAERLADQSALRAGVPVIHAALPDLGRGQLGLVDGPFAAGAGDLFRDPFEDGGNKSAAVVLLAEDGADPRLGVVEDLVRDRGIALSTVTAEQSDPLARAAYLIAVADFAASYLALITGIGPDQGTPSRNTGSVPRSSSVAEWSVGIRDDVTRRHRRSGCACQTSSSRGTVFLDREGTGTA